MVEFNFIADLDIIKYLLQMSNIELVNQLGISLDDIFKIYRTNTCSKELANKIYDYAYNMNLDLNDILWQEAVDEYRGDKITVLCHGSRSGLVGNIRLDVNGASNDFASGFYCGQTLKQAEMFVAEEPDACLYFIQANLDGLARRFFTSNTDWMIAVAYYRDKLQEYKNSDVVKQIVASVDDADYVVAPIADNCLFEIIDAFAAGELTDKQARNAMSATHLGFQYVFRTPKAISQVTPIKKCFLCDAEKENYRMLAQNAYITSMYKAELAKHKFANEGLYIYDILK